MGTLSTGKSSVAVKNDGGKLLAQAEVVTAVAAQPPCTQGRDAKVTDTLNDNTLTLITHNCNAWSTAQAFIERMHRD
eukprot:9285801-Pyramimonas_sp.AAC.1